MTSSGLEGLALEESFDSAHGTWCVCCKVCCSGTWHTLKSPVFGSQSCDTSS